MGRHAHKNTIATDWSKGLDETRLRDVGGGMSSDPSVMVRVRYHRLACSYLPNMVSERVRSRFRIETVIGYRSYHWYIVATNGASFKTHDLHLPDLTPNYRYPGGYAR